VLLAAAPIFVVRLVTLRFVPATQVPRYIITIHQLLAHTPHDHVERKSLEFALSKLEEISQVNGENLHDGRFILSTITYLQQRASARTRDAD
jgi:hypothetical protein